MKKEDITVQDIDRLANLSALEFTDEEKESLISEVSGIVKMLNQCDNVEVTEYEFDNTIALADLREDEVGESLTNEEALINAPKQRKGYYNVPRVVE